MREGEITGSLTHTCYHPCHPPPPKSLVPQIQVPTSPNLILSAIPPHAPHTEMLPPNQTVKLVTVTQFPPHAMWQCVILFGMRSSDWPVTCQPPGGSSSSPYRNTLGSSSSTVREGSRYQIGWIFGKVPKGGGAIFNPKIYIADFGNFKQCFLIMKLIQNCTFRVQDMFFSTIVHLTHFEECTSDSLYYLAIIPPRIYATLFIIKKFAT